MSILATIISFFVGILGLHHAVTQPSIPTPHPTQAIEQKASPQEIIKKVQKMGAVLHSSMSVSEMPLMGNRHVISVTLNDKNGNPIKKGNVEMVGLSGMQELNGSINGMYSFTETATSSGVVTVYVEDPDAPLGSNTWLKKSIIVP